MFGKHFTSMYHGSMRGKGSAFFAVWGYVISHMQPNAMFDRATTVELNSEIIGFLIGEQPDVVVGVISEMCGPDMRSGTKDEDGRKLVRLGEYTYRVVNGDSYRKIRNENERREYQRRKQAEYRARKKNGAPEAESFSEPAPPDGFCGIREPPSDTDSFGESQVKHPAFQEPKKVSVPVLAASIPEPKSHEIAQNPVAPGPARVLDSTKAWSELVAGKKVVEAPVGDPERPVRRTVLDPGQPARPVVKRGEQAP